MAETNYRIKPFLLFLWGILMAKRETKSCPKLTGSFISPRMLYFMSLFFILQIKIHSQPLDPLFQTRLFSMIFLTYKPIPVMMLGRIPVLHLSYLLRILAISILTYIIDLCQPIRYPTICKIMSSVAIQQSVTVTV